MNVNTHLIQEEVHSSFINEKRKDPITSELISAGDTVVFCMICKSAFLVESWRYMGEKHCNQFETLDKIPSSKELNVSYNIPINVKEKEFEFYTSYIVFSLLSTALSIFILSKDFLKTGLFTLLLPLFLVYKLYKKPKYIKTEFFIDRIVEEKSMFLSFGEKNKTKEVFLNKCEKIQVVLDVFPFKIELIDKNKKVHVIQHDTLTFNSLIDILYTWSKKYNVVVKSMNSYQNGILIRKNRSVEHGIHLDEAGIFMI